MRLKHVPLRNTIQTNFAVCSPLFRCGRDAELVQPLFVLCVSFLPESAERARAFLRVVDFIAQ